MANQHENDKPISMANQPGDQAARVENDTPSASSTPPPQRKKDWTPEERNAAQEEYLKLRDDEED